MSTIIRKANQNDTQILCELMTKLMLDQKEKDQYINQLPDIKFGDEVFKEKLSNEKCAIFVTENENKVNGFIEVWLAQKDFYFPIDDYAYILHCYIEPDSKEKGISKKLYQTAEDWAISHKCKYIQVDIFTTNSKVAQVVTYYLDYLPFRTRYIKNLH